MSNSKKQKDHSELVDEKVEVSTVSESDVAASKEEDPFHTAVESITSSPVTSEKEAEEYVSNQTFAAANEHEMQALISILEGEAPADRKAILKALVQREKLKEGASKKTEVNENELKRRLEARRLSLQEPHEPQDLRKRKISSSGRASETSELGQGDWTESRYSVRRPRRSRKGRHHPSLHGASQSPRSTRRCFGKSRLSVSSVNGTSSVT